MPYNTEMAAAAAAAFNRWFFVLFVDVPSDPVRLISATGPYPFAGTGDADLDGETFEPAPWLSISAIRRGSDGRADAVSLSASAAGDDRAALLGLLEAQWFGAPAKLWLGAFDPETMFPVSAPSLILTGTLDRLPYVIGGDRSTVTAEIVSARQLVDRNGSSRLSHEQQQQDHAGDNAFAFMADLAKRQVFGPDGQSIDTLRRGRGQARDNGRPGFGRF